MWQHHLREPLPSQVPHDDNSLHEVRLDGSINAQLDAPGCAGLFAESLRALRPGAPIHIHGLSGDRESRSTPALPGPAAAVRYVPATSAVLDQLARAGFADIRIEKLSQTARFIVDGVPMRELRIAARKPGYRPKAAAHHAVYLGPMAQVEDRRRCRKLRVVAQFEFKALTGLTMLTLLAAMKIARKPAARSSAQATAYVAGSKVCTPKT